MEIRRKCCLGAVAFHRLKWRAAHGCKCVCVCWVCAWVRARCVWVRACARECWNDGLFYARMHIHMSIQQQAFPRSDLDTRSFRLSKHKYTLGFWFLFLLLSLCINNNNNMVFIWIFYSNIKPVQINLGDDAQEKKHVCIFYFLHELRTSIENIKTLCKTMYCHSLSIYR